jgi:hypothetical protein
MVFSQDRGARAESAQRVLHAISTSFFRHRSGAMRRIVPDLTKGSWTAGTSCANALKDALRADARP